MKKVHIVGGKYSFTYIAWKERYGNKNPFESHTHGDLVTALLEGEIPRDEVSIVPLWNSNSGPVNMDQKTKTPDIFSGQAGAIVDLWPNGITYALGVKGDNLSDKCKIFSVKVASDQCRKFLKKIKVHNTERFKGHNTTTEAGTFFQQNAAIGDGLLCSEMFLQDNGIATKNDRVTNPYNMTIFSTLNSLPKLRGKSKERMFSLGCIITELNGNELPPEFREYWKSLFTSHQAEDSIDILHEIPKILFILRYEQSKALMLLEMPSDTPQNPWPEPEREADIIDTGLEIIDSKGQVGLIHQSFSAEEKTLFLNHFMVTEDKIVFYGLGETFIWASPALNIFVHGFDPELVKECALLQVLNLKSLMDYGISMPPSADKLLSNFERSRKRLKLDPSSQPATI
ncbi:MAG: prephenate dehydratase domain-containing protein [Thermodesulfovibrionia bacterium]|nr:prephenate dehydratase domain-containing protein [Thermodesulfovibrionia bacterium]